MNAPQHTFAGNDPSFQLPVTLSQAVRRGVLLATGTEPAAEQVLHVVHLTQLELDQRERLVDLLDKVNIGVVRRPGPHPEMDDVEVIAATGFLWLHQGHGGKWARYLPGPDGSSFDLQDVHYPAGDRTIDAVEHLHSLLDKTGQARLDAMLQGAPLVEDLGDSNELTIDRVLVAYEQALEMAEQLIEVADAGLEQPFDLTPFAIAADAVFLYPSGPSDDPARNVTILKSADPDAYENAKNILATVEDVPANLVQDAVNTTCRGWHGYLFADSDAGRVDYLLKNYMRNALSEHEASQRQAAANEQYEACRAKWITKHGSQRLKRAAGRGYRHDGIYRDERLDIELPGFVGSLGRRAKTRDLMNPSAEALEMEADTLARAEALGIDEAKVSLIYAQPDDENPAGYVDGEFVQVEEYLGRHTVWRSVSGETVNDEIPF